jgi:hypothetical protein
MSGVHHQPDGAAFDIVLLLHVACVVVGLVTSLTAAATAARLRRHLRAAAPLPEPLRRYFRPGVNWAGRTIYGIPVFGFALVAMSQGAYALRAGWVLGGVALFAGVALVAEGAMWPAERRLQAALAAMTGVPGSGSPSAPESDAEPDGATVGDATAMARAAQAALVLLVAGVVLMIAQP